MTTPYSLPLLVPEYRLLGGDETVVEGDEVRFRSPGSPKWDSWHPVCGCLGRTGNSFFSRFHEGNIQIRRPLK